MRTLLVTLALLTLPTFAFAQDPCAAASASVRNPFRVQVCSDLTDTDGLAVAPSALQVRISIDGVAQPLRALPAPTSTTGGINLYEFTGQTSTKGSHSVVATLVYVDGDGVSTASPFQVRGAPMKAPTARVGQ